MICFPLGLICVHQFIPICVYMRLKIYKNKSPRRVAGAGCFNACVSGSALDDTYRSAAARPLDIEFHPAIDLGEQCVILADADVHAWMKLSTALADDNIACQNLLNCVPLNTKSLRRAIPSVSLSSACFFVCLR